MSAAPISAADTMSPDEGWIAICTLDHLTARKMICTRVAKTDLIVMIDAKGIHACERACPHEQADLGLGHVTEGRIHCPRHQAWFDLDTGAISPGWSSRPLRRFPVKVVDEQVWLDATAV